MSLRVCAEQILYIVDLEDGTPDSIGSVSLWIGVANGFFLSSRIVFDGDLNDVFDIALSGRHLGSVKAKQRCWMTTEQTAYSPHCALVPCVETLRERAAQGL